MSAKRTVRESDIAYGVGLSRIYDGVAFWVLHDGTRVNRWAGFEGFESRATAVEKAMKEWEPEPWNSK